MFEEDRATWLKHQFLNMTFTEHMRSHNVISECKLLALYKGIFLSYCRQYLSQYYMLSQMFPSFFFTDSGQEQKHISAPKTPL